MTLHAIARRYAKALLDIAIAEDDPVIIGTQLGAVRTMIEGHTDLRRVLTHPAVPTARKRAVVEALLARDPRLAAPVTKLLLLLADRDRLGVLGQVTDAYGDALRVHQQIVRAEVTTAVALSSDAVHALEQGLSRATGKRVSLETRVDPSILGGVIARLGSVVYDGSVTRQLERMKATLIEGA